MEYLEKMLAQFKDHEYHQKDSGKLHDEYVNTVRKNYYPLHKDLLTMKESFFVPSFLEAIRKNDRESLRSIMVEETTGVFSFDMLTEEYCNKLLEEIAHFESWCVDHRLKVYRPNSMNNYGAILDDFGFYPILQEWVSQLVTPFSRFLYPHFGGNSLDSHHGFVVEYKMGKDVDLDFHVDDSDVTLNVCLGKKFKDGTLYFRGVRCNQHTNTPSKSGEEFNYSHEIGRGVLHVGSHRHGANEITSGERYNLIIWCTSSEFRKSSSRDSHQKWCGWR